MVLGAGGKARVSLISGAWAARAIRLSRSMLSAAASARRSSFCCKSPISPAVTSPRWRLSKPQPGTSGRQPRYCRPVSASSIFPSRAATAGLTRFKITPRSISGLRKDVKPRRVAARERALPLPSRRSTAGVSVCTARS